MHDSVLPCRVANLKIDPSNVAIPLSSIDQDEKGQLEFVFYIQLEDSFLSREDLLMVVEVIHRSVEIRTS